MYTICIGCFLAVPLFGLAAEEAVKKRDVPRGYEDAGKGNPAAKPAAAADGLPEGLPEGSAPAIAPAPAKADPQPPNPQIRQLEQQIRPQVVAYAKSELSLLRHVCLPSEEEDARIVEAAKASVQAVTRELATKMAGPRVLADGRRIVVPNGGVIQGPQSAGDPDPRLKIQEVLLLAVRTVMSEPMSVRYQEELESRRAFRKRAMAERLVASLDDLLDLSTQQRGDLTESLMANWNPQWELVMNQFMRGNRGYVPEIPNAVVMNVLTENQRRVWNRLQKIGGQHFGGNVFMGNQNVLDQFIAQDARRAGDREGDEPDPFAEAEGGEEPRR